MLLTSSSSSGGGPLWLPAYGDYARTHGRTPDGQAGMPSEVTSDLRACGSYHAPELNI